MLFKYPMDDNSTSTKPPGLTAEEASHASSELNNLLQVIAGATSMLETPGADAEQGRAMLRESIGRAEKLAAGLAVQAGGTSARTLTRAEAESGKARREKEDGKGPRQLILVVDDEQMGLTLLKHVLTSAGFEVVTAQSGFECLEQFRLRPHAFALILLDLTMPFMDGEETFARLKEIRADVPVILATGFIQQERLERMMSRGMAGFLRKPMSPDEIVAMVRRTLAELRYSSAPGPGGFSMVM